MKKLNLRIDDVNVNTFEVSAAEMETVGTVQGAAALTRWTFCFDETCFATCDVDC